jgi:hypothetical protein
MDATSDNQEFTRLCEVYKRMLAVYKDKASVEETQASHIEYITGLLSELFQRMIILGYIDLE